MDFRLEPEEEAFRDERIPYQIVGATQFYARKEIKDLLAYLRLAARMDIVCIQAPCIAPESVLLQGYKWFPPGRATYYLPVVIERTDTVGNWLFEARIGDTTAQESPFTMPRGQLTFDADPTLQDGDTLIASGIYEWFAVDFGGETGVLAHLKRYAEPALLTKLEGFDAIDDYAYDWGLNDAAR